MMSPRARAPNQIIAAVGAAEFMSSQAPLAQCATPEECLGRGEAALKRRDFESAAATLGRGCMLGGGDACLRLARLMLGGQGVPQNVNAAGMVLDLSCGSLKHGASCAELGHLMRRGYPPERRAEPAASESMEAETKGEFTRTTAPRVPRHAAVVLRSGCDLGNAPSCAALAEMLLAGEGGVSRDEREAELALETACAAKDHDACAVYAARLLEHGRPTDVTMARALLRQAAAAGNEAAYAWVRVAGL